MKSGICPKCKSANIWLNQDMETEQSTIRISVWKRFKVEQYCCIDCGFYENYIQHESLNEASNIKAVKSNFKKVHSSTKMP